MNTPKYQDFSAPECLRRRFWICVDPSLLSDNSKLDFKSRLLRVESLKNLIGIGYREDRFSHTLNYKSTDLNKILRIYRRTEEILGKNGYSDSIRIKTQPICKNCGALLKFSSRVCQDCGSCNIERGGQYDVNSQRIIFERKGGNG
jgi:hypothetical protein